MYNAEAYSAASATLKLASTTIARRDPTEHDVQIEILFCGICHSDLHSVRNEWSEFMPTVYPIVPGDLIWFAPGEKHWHGARPTTAMTHIAIQEKLDGKVVDWMEQVSDEQYRAGK